MVKIKRFCLFLFLWLTPSLLWADSSVNLIASSEEEVIIKISIPNFERKQIKTEGTLYQRIAVEGWGKTGDAGSPQLPMRGVLMGIPAMGTVKAEVIDAEEEELSGLNIYPCPRRVIREREGEIYVREVFYRDEALYARDSYSPGRLVDVSETGYMRNQRVAKIDIYPFQYNPMKKTLRVYREMLVRVSFEGEEIGPLTYSKEELPYERMLARLLVNYESLDRYEVEEERQRGYLPGRAGENGVAELKLYLREEGIYKIGYSNLSSLWQLGSIDPRKIHLKHLGVEIPILFQGENDGHFGTADYFLFYAPPFKSEYTKDDVYWLTVESTNGLRMGSINGSSGAGEKLRFFRNVYHGEEDHEYMQKIPNGSGKDHWFWKSLTVPNPPSPVEFNITFTLQNTAPCSSCHEQLTFSLQGGNDDKNVYPDHHTQVLINGYLVSDDWWDGVQELTKTVTFSTTYLKEGNNTLTVRSVGDTGAGTDCNGKPADMVYFNYFDVTYKDSYIAERDRLKFKGESMGTPGNYVMEVSGFVQTDMLAFDITEPASPKTILTTPCYSCHALKFSDYISDTKDYMAVTLSGGVLTPVSIEEDIPSVLKDSSNGADYIIITHENFYDAIQPLADHRSAQGKRVMVVKMGDVYDEFSYGISDPQAIRDFLKYAYENYQTPAPLYTLLVGDANLDYKDNFNFGTPNYVPTHLCQTEYIYCSTTMEMVTPTDNWFACVSGDDLLPDMYIGRISVRNAGEATGVVNKIINYEQAGSEAWHSRALFVADDIDQPQDMRFEAINEILISYLPLHFQPYRVYLQQPPYYGSPVVAKPDLMNNIGQGRLITVYVGHGNRYNWSYEAEFPEYADRFLFLTSDVTNLTNSGMPTFVITLTCLNGFYASPEPAHAYCLAEEFLRHSGKGAVACLAPTDLGYIWEHEILGKKIFDHIFNWNEYIIGPAITAAKIDAYNYSESSDLIQSFTLFGDPATILRVE